MTSEKGAQTFEANDHKATVAFKCFLQYKRHEANTNGEEWPRKKTTDDNYEVLQRSLADYLVWRTVESKHAVGKDRALKIELPHVYDAFTNEFHDEGIAFPSSCYSTKDALDLLLEKKGVFYWANILINHSFPDGLVGPHVINRKDIKLMEPYAFCSQKFLRTIAYLYLARNVGVRGMTW